MSTVSSAGHFAAWDGGCLMVSPPTRGVVPVHAHYAIQIAFGPARGLRFRASERAEWAEYDAAIIPSRQPHSMDPTHLPHCAVLFVEPETREGRALAERWIRGGITEIPGAKLAGVAPALFSAWLELGDAAAMEDAARRVVRALTSGAEPSVVSDERILRATAYIRSHLDAPLTLEEVAAEACLSPSRFRHLFVEQTGMALRPYILWRRFLRAFELLTAGAPISAAAHAAGFADAAHLTRTCRRTFGFPPSIMMAGVGGRADAGVAHPAGHSVASTTYHAAGQPLRSRP